MGAEGVKWVTNNSSPTLTRYHGASGSNTLYSPANQAAATTYFNSLAPWGVMGRVSLRPDGSVSSRCNVNTTPLQTGDNCYSDTDQTGLEQKMVYIPQFCYAIDTLTANQVWYWIGKVGDQFEKSDTSGTYTFSASDIHPAFIVDGVAKAGVYIGAYEAYNSSSVLQSVAGVAPTASTTKANFRAYAEAIGAGWELMTIQIYSALQYLFIIEYGSLYSRSVLGYGVGSGSMINTGHTTSNGNASYGTTANTTTPMSYRGVENLYGNLYKYAEGIRTDASYNVWIQPQTALHTYSDSSTLGSQSYYVNSSLTTISSSGYITGVNTGAALSWGFIPSAASGGSGSTYFCGWGNVDASNTVWMTGGSATGAPTSAEGVFGMREYAGNQAYVGARICYLPS